MPCYGRFGYVNMIKHDLIFKGKDSTSLQVIFLLYAFASYMVYAASNELITDVQGGVYTVGPLERVATEVFIQHEWQHNLWISPPPPSTYA